MRSKPTRPAGTGGAGDEPAEGGVFSLALVAICVGYFMVILDATIVNVALPALGRDLRVGVAELQWVVDGYTLMLAALLLTGGALADRLGDRRTFEVGLAIFVLASAACGLAPSADVLIGSRFVQGLGAALAVPASLSLLRAAYPDPSRRARAVGVWGGVAGIAAAAGPVLGGVLIAALSWRLVFLINVPIGLAGLVLAARRVPGGEPRPRRLDLPGQIAGILSLAALTLALIEAGSLGVASAPVLGGVAVFLAALCAFVLLERASANPMIPLSLFRNGTFTGANGVGLLINLGFYGELFVLNLYFQRVLHYPALAAGLALLPQMGVVALASALSGRLTGRVGSPRPTMLIGLVAGGVGLLGLTVAGQQTAYGLLVAPLMAAGSGMAFTMPAATTAVVESTPERHAGVGSGAINAARQVGSVIGVALLGAFVNRGAGFVPGLRLALIVAGAAFFTAALLTLLLVERAPERWVPSVRSTARRRARGRSGPGPTPAAGSPGAAPGPPAPRR